VIKFITAGPKTPLTWSQGKFEMSQNSCRWLACQKGRRGKEQTGGVKAMHHLVTET
jgi:hypothetical protein